MMLFSALMKSTAMSPVSRPTGDTHVRILLFMLSIHQYYPRSEAALRVFGGRDALKDEFPYIIRIETQREELVDEKATTEFYQLCTGAALTATWILAAAHCANEEDFKRVDEKLVARYNSYFPQHHGNIRPIFEIKIAPAFLQFSEFPDKFKGMWNSDLCLFRSDNIMIARYGKVSAVDYLSLVGHEALTLGFGTTPARTHKPLQVLKGMLYDCTEQESYLVSSLCLTLQCGQEATICGGDSGGPVVHPSGIVGVNSMSIGDCHKYTTFLYDAKGTSASIVAMVSPVFDWISNIISNNTSGRL